MSYNISSSWEVEFSSWFEKHWQRLSDDEQVRIDASVHLLERYGPQLPFPHSSSVKGSKFSQMRELRVQIKGRPYRYLYAYDSRRVAVLLCGGNKAGLKRFYDKMVPIADKLFEQHLMSLKREK